ncbi:hypothetical protein CSA37_13410 [Candidatus Fermentibacteria bacterium]|nr:MAG: hypothetical protein CSA37_13410 [Candidatus Fermentibacteria bacterium]
MKERTGRHSAPGYALRSVAAEERGRKSTLNREVFSLDNPGHLRQLTIIGVTLCIHDQTVSFECHC